MITTTGSAPSTKPLMVNVPKGSGLQGLAQALKDQGFNMGGKLELLPKAQSPQQPPPSPQPPPKSLGLK